MSQVTLTTQTATLELFTSDFIDRQGILILATPDFVKFIDQRHADYRVTEGKLYYVSGFYHYGFDILDDDDDTLEVHAEDANSYVQVEYIDTVEGGVSVEQKAEKVTEVTIAPDVSELSTDQLIRIISLHDSAVQMVSERINPIMGKICDFVGTKFTEEEISIDAENDKA